MMRILILVLMLAGCASQSNDKIVFNADVLDWSLGPNSDKPYPYEVKK